MEQPDNDGGTAPALVPAVALVLPGNVDTAISGGNIYDRRLRDGLRQAGAGVVVLPVDGTWPQPDAASEQKLAVALAEAGGATGRPVIVDGLLAGCPTVIRQAVDSGVDVRILVHMPLALDAGLDPETATRLDRFEREALHASHGVIATSAWAADELRRRHHLSGVAVAAPGVDRAPAATGSVPPRLLQVGTISPVKNQLTTVAALAQLTGFDWTAALIGPAPDAGYLQRVQNLIDEAGLQDRIGLTGELTGAALERQWQAANISVLPSRTETYGMVVAESLAHAVPVIVAAGTGAADTLGCDSTGRRPGFVVDTDSPDELAAALSAWLGDESLQRDMRAAAAGRRTMLTGWGNTVQAVLKTLI